MHTNTVEQLAIATVNGVGLHSLQEILSFEQLRQRAYTELLRQAAIEVSLLNKDDLASDDGIISEAASNAIEILLDRELKVKEPSEKACLRYHVAHQAHFSSGERVELRHILFAVTPGVDVSKLRLQAEKTLLDVRCHDGYSANLIFSEAAKTLSNCPSGEQGGDLGWLTKSDCAPEFAKEIFGHFDIGVLSRIIHSRFGLHVVQILSRDLGVAQNYEEVRVAVVMALQQKSYITALHTFLSKLTTQAKIEGIQLDMSSL
jgi:peptidyl-prolyl cis-trans isomerase C